MISEVNLTKTRMTDRVFHAFFFFRTNLELEQVDKAARKLSSPRKSCFGECLERSLQMSEEALPRYTEAFMQYAKEIKRESYSCHRSLRQGCSEVKISRTQRVKVWSESLLTILCVLFVC